MPFLSILLLIVEQPAWVFHAEVAVVLLRRFGKDVFLMELIAEPASNY